MSLVALAKAKLRLVRAKPLLFRPAADPKHRQEFLESDSDIAISFGFLILIKGQLMEAKRTSLTAPHYDQTMPCEIELIFQDQGLGQLLRGKFKVDRSLLTVTAEDGRRKTAQLSGQDADALARLMLHEMEVEKLH